MGDQCSKDSKYIDIQCTSAACMQLKIYIAPFIKALTQSYMTDLRVHLRQPSIMFT